MGPTSQNVCPYAPCKRLLLSRKVNLQWFVHPLQGLGRFTAHAHEQGRVFLCRESGKTAAAQCNAKPTGVPFHVRVNTTMHFITEVGCSRVVHGPVSPVEIAICNIVSQRARRLSVCTTCLHDSDVVQKNRTAGKLEWVLGSTSAGIMHLGTCVVQARGFPTGCYAISRARDTSCSR